MTGVVVAGLAVAILGVADVLAHCDGLDGPVVNAARRAIETQNVNLVLIWVQRQDEAEVTAAFRQALAVRRLGPESRELADRYLFETLVRLHRAGEGAAYTGLKPAGRDLGPAIPAADRALETRALAPLEQLLLEAVRAGVRDQYRRVIAMKDYDPNNVEAGREYVRSYVQFIHYIERLHEAAGTPASGHYPEPLH